jgi:hypothetical protein
LLGLLLARLAGLAFGLRRLGGASAAGVALLAGLAFAAAAPEARADSTPSKELLEELGQRVLEAPKCTPTCGHLAWAEVAAQGDELRVGLEFHAAEQVGVPLPGAAELLAVRELRLDGALDSPAHRDANGSAWIVLGRGVHRVDIVYRAAAADQIGLAFPLKPARLRFSGKDWEAAGVSDERLLTDTLELTRVQGRQEGAAAGVVQQFPAFVRVTRELDLGLEWSATSTAERIAPEQAAFSVRVPLMPGERVLTSDLKVEKGELIVPVQAGEGSAAWESQLERRDTLVLEAPPLAHHAEVWRVVAGPMWNVVASGVPAVMPQLQGDGWVYEFHPLPGEKLTLAIRRPESIAGGTLAIDGVSLTSQFGKRAATHTLALSLRSTQGGQHAIVLPKGRGGDGGRDRRRHAEPEATGRQAQSPGASRRARRGGDLPRRRRHRVARGHARRGPRRRGLERAPGRGGPGGSLGAGEQRPARRSGGALLGRVAGDGAGRVRTLAHGPTPLRFHHWLLLGLGFSTFSWLALLIVVAWLFALDARGRAGDALRTSWFNARQVLLLLFTAVAGLTLFASMGQGLLGTPTCTWSEWLHGEQPALVPGSHRLRAARRRRDQRADVGVQGRDAGLGAVARDRAGALAALGIRVLLGRRLLARGGEAQAARHHTARRDPGAHLRTRRRRPRDADGAAARSRAPHRRRGRACRGRDPGRARARADARAADRARHGRAGAERRAPAAGVGGQARAGLAGRLSHRHARVLVAAARGHPGGAGAARGDGAAGGVRAGAASAG